MSQTLLLYVADPMCSWCWGFTPIAHDIRNTYGPLAPLKIIAGGLAPGNRRVWNHDDKVTVREHWDHVHAASAQPFNYSLFERDDFVYDTEPACRALVACRELGDTDPLAYLEAMHRAFYVSNLDITDSSVLRDLADECGMQRQRFAQCYASPETEQLTHADFELARALGVQGFPTVVGLDDTGMVSTLSAGFRRWRDIQPRIEQWLRSVRPETAESAR